MNAPTALDSSTGTTLCQPYETSTAEDAADEFAVLLNLLSQQKDITMHASKESLEMAGEIVQKRSPNVFVVFDLEHSAQPVYEYLRQHPEIGQDLDQTPRYLYAKLVSIFESAILLMIDRGKLQPIIDSTPEVEAEIERMRARVAKNNPPPEPVAEVPVVPPAPVKTRAQIESELDDQFVAQYKTGYSKEFRDATKRDPKQRARMERLIAAGRI